MLESLRYFILEGMSLVLRSTRFGEIFKKLCWCFQAKFSETPPMCPTNLSEIRLKIRWKILKICHGKKRALNRTSAHRNVHSPSRFDSPSVAVNWCHISGVLWTLRTNQTSNSDPKTQISQEPPQDKCPNPLRSRRIVKEKAQNSPLVYQFSGGF